MQRKKSMKTHICAVLFFLALNANAALIDRGNGLIYDEDLDITWLQDANYSKTSGYDGDGLMDYNQATLWVNLLEYRNFTNWRLPTSDINCDSLSNCSTGEMNHLFYIELGGSSYTSILDSSDPDLLLFSNIQTNNLYYWSRTISSSYTPPFTGASGVVVFNFETGSMRADDDGQFYYSWAVHDGDIGAVPIPAAAWLFSSGLLGLVGMARRKKAA